jgi:hypothetical protein
LQRELNASLNLVQERTRLSVVHPGSRSSISRHEAAAMTSVVEIFLPLDTRTGRPIDLEVIEGIVKGLADRFGGATAYTREPAEGLWKRSMAIERDRIIIVEVLVDEIDEVWWHDYRRKLEGEFEQDKVLIRVTPCRVI